MCLGEERGICSWALVESSDLTATHIAWRDWKDVMQRVCMYFFLTCNSGEEASSATTWEQVDGSTVQF